MDVIVTTHIVLQARIPITAEINTLTTLVEYSYGFLVIAQLHLHLCFASSLHSCQAAKPQPTCKVQPRKQFKTLVNKV